VTYRIIQGDARDVLKTLPERSVQACITSPPYWGQRAYKTGSDREIGSEPTPELWVTNLVEVFREVRRVLRDDGTLWLNVGDKYAGSGGAGGDYNKGGLKASANGSGPGASHLANYKAKDLIGLPWMLAFALRADGWYLRSEIIWHKVSPMPQSVTDRPTTAHEQLFLFAKSGVSQYWTHRDHAGTRTRPAPDYRWKQGGDDAPESWNGSAFDDGKTAAVHPDIGQRDNRPAVELTEAPPGWRAKRADCQCCGGIKEKHWSRVNLWATHDYYYDAEAVREQNTEGTIARMQSKPVLMGNKTTGGLGHWKGATGYEAATGRSARSVQAFAPSPFSVSRLGKYGPMPDVDHFALMPISMATWCIKAGTSEKGCCATCGAPWVRQLERTQPVKRAVDSAYAKNASGHAQGRLSTQRWDEPIEVKTIGWAEPQPCVVLDPFMGAGTTALAAERLGRNSIGIELSADYIRLAEARLKDDAPLTAGAGT
jgi:DNA modification methylase